MKKYIVIATALSFAVSALPALASTRDHHQTTTPPAPTRTITVSNSNWAMVSNTVSTGANTGDNSALGGNAGNVVSGSGSNGDNSATGGFGGTIVTGNAGASSGVSNTVNSNKTAVDLCGCTTTGNTTVTVSNHSGASVGNDVNTQSNTGYNMAVGGDAGNSVSGSVSVSSNNDRHHSSDNENTGWNGGNAAVGGGAGDILTGDAGAESIVVNVVNSNVTRVN